MGMEIQIDSLEDMCALMCDNVVPEGRRRMTNKEALEVLRSVMPRTDNDKVFQAIQESIKALELLDTLTDRPCSVCRHRKENGCSKWDCVFDGHIGG